MVRLTISKRLDTLDFDILRGISEGRNYPNAACKELSSRCNDPRVPRKDRRKIDDETVRLRFKLLCKEGLIETTDRGRRKRYKLTAEGERLLKSEIAVDKYSKRKVVYLARTGDSPETGELLVAACKATEIRYQDNLASVGIDFGAVRLPFVRQGSNASISIESKGLARIVVPRGWSIQRFPNTAPEGLASASVYTIDEV
jgi:DNA-binding PadR family transcriptional regulator